MPRASAASALRRAAGSECQPAWLKLGVIIYTGAVVGNLTAEALRRGELELVRLTGSGHEGLPTLGMTRWQHDSADGAGELGIPWFL